MTIERMAVARYAGGRIVHVPVVRAGRWVFATGLRAVDASGLVPPQVLNEERPFDPPPKPEREARFIFQRLKGLLGLAGSDIANVVRLDQYYPDWRSVDPYHVARKEALRGTGDRAWFGWPTLPRLEELRGQWFDAPDLDAQKKLAREIQVEALREAPYLPLGQYFQATAYRRGISGMLRGLPLFWNIHKA